MGYRLVCCLLVLTMCGACAPQASVNKSASDEWRMQNMEARFLEFQEAQKEREATMQSQMQELDGRLTAVRQELDETKAKTGELQAEAAALKEALRARSMAGGNEAVIADTAQPAPAAASAASEPAPSPQAMKEAKPGPVMSGGPSKAETQYEQGLALVRAGDVEKGRALLDGFIGDHPKHPLVPNALYWMGETYYHEKRYAQAVLTFKEVVRRFPKHDKAAAAMLKTGFSYDQLGDKSNARFYLQTLIEDYPSSSPAAIARKHLASM